MVNKEIKMFKCDKMQRKIPLRLPWHIPRLHIAWGSSYHWGGIFSAFKSYACSYVSDCEDSNFLF